jgi:prepilin-type N-terminal cleavage/methylation domain-containing protein
MYSLRHRDGLTLMELIIVLAVVAIIGAILIPSFLTTTDRARLKSDVQSARIIQNALDLHNAERDTPITATTVHGTNGIIYQLKRWGYLDARYSDQPQTHGARYIHDAARGVLVDISPEGVSPRIRDTVYHQLTGPERAFIHGGTPAQASPSPT